MLNKTTQKFISQYSRSIPQKAAYGSGFQVLYIPDYGSCQEIIINAVCTLNAALEGPIHQILLVVRAERVEIIQEYLKTMIVKFRRYRHLVTVAVTHWDTNETETTKKANEELIIKLSKNFGINSVIFVSKFDTGEKVCAQIDSILNKCQAENFELTEAELYSNFDLIEQKEEVEMDLDFSKDDVHSKQFRL